MFLRELRKITRPHWFDILFTLKRSTGMSVGDLAKTLKMSYMGIKQHCVDLEKRGFLDTWRQPLEEGETGRPEKIYRLTPRANVFFPSFASEVTMEILNSVRDAYGANAPEKLLYTYFGKKAQHYQNHIKGETLADRATSFAIIRGREGFLCVVEHDPEAEIELHIVEYHNPLREILDKYPSAIRMEQAMIERALRCTVQRRQVEHSGLVRAIFHLCAAADDLG